MLTKMSTHLVGIIETREYYSNEVRIKELITGLCTHICTRGQIITPPPHSSGGYGNVKFILTYMRWPNSDMRMAVVPSQYLNRTFQISCQLLGMHM